MNTLNYLGCKKKLCFKLLTICKNHIGAIDDLSFADLFAGTGAVGYFMKDHTKQIISNDFEYFSYVINNALLRCHYSEKLKNIIETLNSVELKEGLITNNYSPKSIYERKYFTIENAKKCDAIRIKIENYYNDKIIDIYEYYFLIASLLISIDKVANTTSVYGSYLKKFKKTSLDVFNYKPIHNNIEYNVTQNIIYNENINQLLDKTYDIVYLDPPYNKRQYGSNYFPLNYISRYDENIQLYGKTGLILNYNKSDFCSKNKVTKAMTNLLNNIKCKYLLLSYNNEGFLSKNELKKLLIHKGSVNLYKCIFKKYKSQNNVNGNLIIEYIWFVDCTSDEHTYTETNI